MERGQGWSFSDFKHEGFESRVRSVGTACLVKKKNKTETNIVVLTDLPCHPVVKTPPFHCRRFNPWSEELGSHMPRSVAQKRKAKIFLQMIAGTKDLVIYE